MKALKVFIFIISLIIPTMTVQGGLTDGLVAYWTFDETEGNIAHDIVGTNNGTLFGDAAWTSGKIGGALQFIGNGWVDVPSSPSLDITGDAITISAWYKPSTNDPAVNYNSQIVSKWLGSDSAYTFGYGEISNYMWLAIDADDNVRAYSDVPVDQINEWYHIVGVYNGSEQFLYINNVPGSSLANTGNIDLTTQSLRISGYPSDWRPLEGTVDDIRIYNRALSPEEVEQLYNIPEPASIIILGIGYLVLISRQKNKT